MTTLSKSNLGFAATYGDMSAGRRLILKIGSAPTSLAFYFREFYPYSRALLWAGGD
jgi:hypothetical protein